MRTLRPVGPEICDEGVTFRIWAPRCSSLDLLLWDGTKVRHSLPMVREDGGYFSTHAADVRAGTRYTFRPDWSSQSYPDPASRFQPGGVHEPSEVIDSRPFGWSDASWHGLKLPGQVIYELHIGTFTPEGTWTAAASKLPHLADVGITLIEVMPVNEFSGEFGWGYDGVLWFAPTRLYGRPDDFRSFVDRAHGLGIGVILDTVYNHFGPSGNYTGAFSFDYYTDKHTTEWGEAINFDGNNSRPVRNLVAYNAAYWIREFHLDGLRIDATHAIVDDSVDHILGELSDAARGAAGDRDILLIAENEYQDVRHLSPRSAGGFNLDGLWNDDFHHAARVAATGHAEGYYADYAGTPQELVSAACRGYLYQGQWHPRQKKRRGTDCGPFPAAALVNFLENHDQVANSSLGLRPQLMTSPGRWRALTALLLLAPGTPMLFMGQEFAASSPFLYFADQEKHISGLVRDGRWQFLRQFSRAADSHVRALLPDPAQRSTMELCKLKWEEVESHRAWLSLHRDLLQLRKKDQTFAAQEKWNIAGAVVGPEAFIIRWSGGGDGDRLLMINLGRDIRWWPLAEPLAASPSATQWDVLWSSDDQKYGGLGVAAFSEKEWFVPGHAATLLCPVAIKD